MINDEIADGNRGFKRKVWKYISTSRPNPEVEKRINKVLKSVNSVGEANFVLFPGKTFEEDSSYQFEVFLTNYRSKFLILIDF